MLSSPLCCPGCPRHAAEFGTTAVARHARCACCLVMNGPPEPRVLADTGGLLVTDDGRRVLVIDRCTGALTTTAFVLGVITLVLGGFGLVAVIASTPSRAFGAIFVAAGIVFAVLTILVVRKIRSRRGQPLNQCRPVAVIDRKLGLFSYRGGALVQLDQVRFARRLQMG